MWAMVDEFNDSKLQAKVQKALESYAMEWDVAKLARAVQQVLPAYFVYRGGDHVAVHAQSGAERLALIARK